MVKRYCIRSNQQMYNNCRPVKRNSDSRCLRILVVELEIVFVEPVSAKQYRQMHVRQILGCVIEVLIRYSHCSDRLFEILDLQKVWKDMYVRWPPHFQTNHGN